MSMARLAEKQKLMNEYQELAKKGNLQDFYDEMKNISDWAPLHHACRFRSTDHDLIKIC